MFEWSFFPGYNSFNYEKLFRWLQCIACKICQCSSIHKLILSRASGVLSLSDHLRYLWGMNCFGNVSRQFELVPLVSKFTHSTLLPLYNVHFRQEISSLESVFAMSAKFCISITVFVSFREKYLELEVQYHDVPFLLLTWEKGFDYLQCSNTSWLERRKKFKE